MPEADFEAYFGASFGARWPALRAALLEPGDSVDFADGLAAPYRLDSASLAAARALRLPESGEILDACAAPGGKTLVIASRMGENARLLANELSSERRRRLADVLDAHLAPGPRSRVRVSGFDAAAAGGRPSERGRFGAVLLDAPCSSERHVLRDERAVAEWTPARVKFLAQRQWSLLSSAFLLLAPGGSLVYATCALSDSENDGPVRRLTKKYGDMLSFDTISPENGAVATEFGVMYLPDAANGAGPLYVCRILKSRHTGNEMRVTQRR